VSDYFPENRERAIGLFTSIFPIGGIIGPNLGGWVVSRYSWRYVFYINLPVGLALMALIAVLLKDSRVYSRPRIDAGGALLFSGSVLFLMFGLNLVGESFSATSLLVAATLLLLSLSFLLLFVHREKKVTSPILDMALLQSKPFLAANLLNLVIGAAVFGLFSFIPLYATSVHNLSTLLSGMILTPRSFGTIIASAVVSFLLRRWGYRWPMVVGFALTSLSTILLGEGLPLWKMTGMRGSVAEVLSFFLLISGIGAGTAFPAANNACIELMPDRVATIVGLRNTFRTVGGALGVSLITFILHLCGDRAMGFRVTFISCGLVLFCSIPLVFFMPSGKKEWG
jgi:MFS family permease